tara:strand:- start:1121 stop:1228 length:108 start_codon:yes stop_codon:yes gene_type:complete
MNKEIICLKCGFEFLDHRDIKEFEHECLEGLKNGK